jgi:hypothetical protein
MTTRRIIFATALAILVNGVNYTANATELQNDSSSKYLVAKSSSEFNSFMNKKAKRFVKINANDWNTFNKVVSMYEVSSGRFQNMTEAEKAEFLQAANSINTKLATMRGEAAAEWMKKLNLTTAIYEFVWNSKVKGERMASEINVPTVINFDRPIGR